VYVKTALSLLLYRSLRWAFSLLASLWVDSSAF